MLTIFATPKAFRGHIATIQRNAITSWTMLRPRPEIILFGDEPGTAGICRELGLAHIPPLALRREVRDDVVVKRVSSTSYPRFRMVGRVSNYLSYLSLAVPRALAIHADVILAMTDPAVAGIAGALVAKLRRCPFVYNIRDLYPDMALGGEQALSHPGGGAACVGGGPGRKRCGAHRPPGGLRRRSGSR